MMLDFTLGLNALVWFAALIFPVYGFVLGYKKRRDLVVRAQLIILCLLVLLLVMEMTLAPFVSPIRLYTLEALKSYRPWLLGGVALTSALGWAAHWLGQRMSRKKP